MNMNIGLYHNINQYTSVRGATSRRLYLSTSPYQAYRVNFASCIPMCGNKIKPTAAHITICVFELSGICIYFDHISLNNRCVVVVNVAPDTNQTCLIYLLQLLKTCNRCQMKTNAASVPGICTLYTDYLFRENSCMVFHLMIYNFE